MSLVPAMVDGRSSARRILASKAGNRNMGFLYYANLLKFVLEGHCTLVLMEHARRWMKAARIDHLAD